MKDFLRQAKTIRKLYFIIFLMAVLISQLLFISIFSDQTISFSKAYDVITAKQKILPMDPIEHYEKIEKSIFEESIFLGNDHYRIMTNLEDREDDVETLPEVSPVTTFNGEAAYPNSRLLIEVHSDEFFVSSLVGDNGKWTWTNNSHPLEKGEHTIKTYNFSPFEISGIKDIFVQEYNFVVKENLSKQKPVTVDLTELPYMHRNTVDKDLLKDIIDNNEDGVYFFDTILINKKNYLKGDKLKIQISAQTLKEGDFNKGNIVYEIFEDNGLEGRKVSEFRDDVILENSNSLLKRIELKNKMLSGSYFLKITLNTDGRKYISINSFNVSSAEIIRAGEVAITREDATKLFLNNIAVILIIIIIILLVILFEYKKFIKDGHIGGSNLGKGGFINN